MTPIDEDTADDEFANHLAKIDEFFGSGRTQEVLEATTDPVLSSRLREAHECLHLLHSAWPSPVEQTERVPFDLFNVRPHSQKLGRFQIEAELGRGGHGVVFLAYDAKLKRQVAIKVPRPENLISPSMRARFQQEAATAANLDHPNLVAIHEFDSNGPVTYLVMAYCPGVSLATWLKQQTTLPDPLLIVRLLLPLVEAVAYMHAHGVLHRDIKPANILLDSTGVQAGQALPGVPKLTDFGLAILAEVNTRHSISGGTVGTLAYMPPEQINMKRSSIGPRLDIFSLGAVLYECLTGKSPFQGVTAADTINQLLMNDPVPPRQLRFSIPRDLEVICGKCLEKKPEHRYASASELADDLNRLLEGEPILARPASTLEIAMKLARRYPVVAAMSVVTTMTILCMFGLGIWHTLSLQEHSRKLQTALNLVESSELQLSLENYPVQIRIADSLKENENLESLSEFLDGLRPKANQEDRRGFEWYYLKNIGSQLRVLRGHRNSVDAVAISPDGRRMVSCSSDGTIHFWDTATGISVGMITTGKPDSAAMLVSHLAYCRDGKNIVTLGANDQESFEVTIWDVATNKIVAQTDGKGFKHIMTLVASATHDIVGFSGFDLDDGQRLALWDWTRGEVRHEALPRLTKDRWWGLTISQDGRKLLAYATLPHEILVWDMPSGERFPSLLDEQTGVPCCSLSADATVLASSTEDNRIRIWDVASNTSIRTGSRQNGTFERFALQPNGQSLAIRFKDRPYWDFVRLYATDNVKSAAKEISVGSQVRDFAWSPDGKMLAIACADRNLRMWRPFPVPSTSTLTVKGQKEVWALAFSPDSKTVAVGYDDEAGYNRETLKLWDIVTGKEIHQLSGHSSMVTGVAFSPTGDRLYSAGYDGAIKIWDLKSHMFIEDLSIGNGAIKALAISPDGSKLATGGKDRILRIHRTGTNQLLSNLPPHQEILQGVAFDSTGNHIAVAENLADVRVWNANTIDHSTRNADGRPISIALPALSVHREQQLDVLSDPLHIMSIAFSPDGTQLATVSQNGIVMVHYLNSQVEPIRLTAHKRGLNIAVAFAPDGKTLATGGTDNLVKLWHVATGRELLCFLNLPSSINRLAFSPDGRHLAAGLLDGSVHLWHAMPPE